MWDLLHLAPFNEHNVFKAHHVVICNSTSLSYKMFEECLIIWLYHMGLTHQLIYA